MKPHVARRIRNLQRMTVGQLRDEYVEVFGEHSRSGNKNFLFRRIAWRLQELDEGGLSERAKRRAQELADDADLRIRPPKGAFAARIGRTVSGPVGSPRRDVPAPGTVLVREYRGQTHEVRVLPSGFEHDGTVYRSLTAVAKAITGTHWNGPFFFGLRSRRAQQ